MTTRASIVRITGLSHGPHGVGRIGGKAVFVRGVAPGEDVEVEITERHDSFDYAALRSLVHVSPNRRQPPCRFLPRCGGCPWQHLEYTAQLEAKQANLTEALRRIAGISDLKPLPIIAAPAELGYRNRLTLKIADRQVGFYAGASHDLVSIDHCLLAAAEVDEAVPLALDLVQRLASNARRIEIAARGFAPGVVMSIEIEGALVDADAAEIPQWIEQRIGVAAVELHGKRWRRTWGDDRVAMEPEPGLQLITRAGTFSQVNPAANQLLVQKVMEMAEFQPEEAVIDLYAGAGNLSVPIARRVRRVMAVEQDAVAAADGNANAAALTNGNLEIVALSARRGLQAQLRREAYFDTVVLDPPRSGAAEVIEDLLQLAPRKLIYVSCNPPTLARDLKELGRKYRLDALQPIDLFPQTYHLETVVRATRR